MKTRHMILILLIALCPGCALPGHFRLSSPSTISSMAPGETMEVEFSSHGCFHQSHYKLAFTRSDGRVTVTGVEIPPMRSPKPSGETGTPLEPKNLTNHEIVGIDRLLAYYRKPSDPSSFSTTTDMIKITNRRKSGIVGSESYTDRSGGIHDQWGVLTIQDLVAKMQPGIRR